MERVTLDGKMTIGCPEGFHVMTEEERSKLSMLEEGPWVGLSDPDRHILVTAGWKAVKGLGSMLKGKSLAENMEKQVRWAFWVYIGRTQGTVDRGEQGLWFRLWICRRGYRYGCRVLCPENR